MLPSGWRKYRTRKPPQGPSMPATSSYAFLLGSFRVKGPRDHVGMIQNRELLDHALEMIAITRVPGTSYQKVSRPIQTAQSH
jgi:hypothetical protein